MNCVFCKIAAHEIKSPIVYEDAALIAFDDNSPVAPVHVLVIPKKHVTEIAKLEPYLSGIFKAIPEIAKKKGVDASGFRVVMNRGGNAGQAVDHLHFHVMGGRQLHWPPG